MEIPRHWRLKKQRYGLVGEVCENEHYVFPPRDVCPDCHGQAHIPHTMSGKGEIYSSTVVHEAPESFGELTSYQLALIKLEEGPIVAARLTDLEKPAVPLKIGAKVEMVTRKLSSDGDRGLINYGYKFRPLTTSLPKGASRSSK